MTRDKITFMASETPSAANALDELRQRYGDVGPGDAEVIVALGGDGFMLSVLHDTQHLSLPIYGMNQGTVGFLMNSFSPNGLLERTAYNLSAHGSIIPLDADILALTPISAFRPRRWRGALLSGSAKVKFEVLEPNKRPVSVVADNQEFRSVVHVEVEEDQKAELRLLFDPEHNLEERILNEQFIP